MTLSISRKLILESRNCWTATSFIALKIAPLFPWCSITSLAISNKDSFSWGTGKNSNAFSEVNILTSEKALEFFPVPHEKESLFEIARDVIEHQGNRGAIFNAINEVAVQQFRDSKISFLEIDKVIKGTYSAMSMSKLWHWHSTISSLYNLINFKETYFRITKLLNCYLIYCIKNCASISLMLDYISCNFK